MRILKTDMYMGWYTLCVPSKHIYTNILRNIDILEINSKKNGPWEK